MAGKPSVGMMGDAAYTAPGVTFTGYAHGMASSPTSIGYGLDKWWVGCSGGQLYSSPTAKAGSWTLVTTFSSFVARKIDYANGRLIIIASDQVKWSTDGSTFNSFAFTSISSSISTCYAGGYYLVAFGPGSAGKYLWTADFTTWTVTTNASSLDIVGFVWDGAKFLAASYFNAALRYFTNPALTAAWTNQGVAPGVNRFNAFVASGSRLLGVGFIVGSNAASWGWTDDGGATWATSGFAGTDPWVDADSSGGVVWMYQNLSGADGRLYKSTDGGATPNLLLSLTSETFGEVAYGDGRFVARTSTKIYIDR